MNAHGFLEAYAESRPNVRFLRESQLGAYLFVGDDNRRVFVIFENSQEEPPIVRLCLPTYGVFTSAWATLPRTGEKIAAYLQSQNLTLRDFQGRIEVQTLITLTEENLDTAIDLLLTAVMTIEEAVSAADIAGVTIVRRESVAQTI